MVFLDLAKEVFQILEKKCPKCVTVEYSERPRINVAVTTTTINGKAKEYLKLLKSEFNTGKISKSEIEKLLKSDLKYYILRYEGKNMKIDSKKNIPDIYIEEYLISDTRTTAKLFKPFCEIEERAYQNIDDYKRSPQIIVLDTLSLFVGYIGWEGYLADRKITTSQQTGGQSISLKKGTGEHSVLNKYIPDFDLYIQNKVKDFVGRSLLFQTIADFTEKRDSGYFRIIGKPGVGKSAFLAKFVQKYKVPHYFINGYGTGNARADTCLRSIYAKLAVDFQLPIEEILAEIEKEASKKEPTFLLYLLKSISQKLPENRKLIFVIDALDEIDDLTINERKNILHFPSILPKGVYFILSMRVPEDYPTLSSFNPESFDLDKEQNEKDIESYIRNKIKSDELQKYIKEQEIDEDYFSKILKEKSENNFMYVSTVLNEIAEGVYHDRNLEQLPQGLNGYYEDHWTRMKGKDEEAWFEYKLPIIAMITEAERPVSVKLISEATGIKDPQKILKTLYEWKHFFHKLPSNDTTQDDGDTKYVLYHKSFCDFLNHKDTIKYENVKLKELVENFATHIGNKLLGEGWDDEGWD